MPFTINPDGTFTLTGIDHTGQIDCSNEIDSVIDSIYQNYGGGKLWLPRPGTYRAAQVIVRGSVMLQGHGRQNTQLGTDDTDHDTVIFAPTVAYGGMRDLFVMGFRGPNPSSNAVHIYENVPVKISDCHIWGGASAIYTAGVDGTIEDCFIAGWKNAAITSNGANWWKRCKMDMTGDIPFLPVGFYQGMPLSPPAGNPLLENNFEQCDFSGNYGASVLIDDGGTHSALSTFDGCVMSSPIVMNNQKHASFVGGTEFGSSTFTLGTGTALVVGCVAPGASLTLPPSVTKSGNTNII